MTNTPDTPERESLAVIIDRMRANDETRRRELVRLEAEVAVLDTFDHFRRAAGHDYGNGQRANELSRLRHALERLHADTEYPGVDGLLTADAGVYGPELEAAATRLLGPRRRRVEKDAAVYMTPSRARTIRALDTTVAYVARRVAEAGA